MKIRNFTLSFISLTLFTMTLLSGCTSEQSGPVEKQGFYMGTVITEKVYGEKADKAADKGMNRIKEIQDEMTINAAGSEIDTLNEAAGNGEFIVLSSDSIQVLKAAIMYAGLSQGAFDVTVGPLVKSWGVFTDDPKIPSSEEISKLKNLVDYHGIVINEADNTARLKQTGQIVDLGAIAKGFAGDEVIKIFKEYGIKSAFVNLGGNVVALGEKPDGSSWSVGIRNPRATVEGENIGILKVKDKAVVTSGDYERYFEKDGIRYHHILDPRTGYPSKSGLVSVTIVADISMDADALSTAAFVLGLDKGMALIRSLNGVEAIFITEDKQIYVTPGITGIFTLTDQSGTYTYHAEE